MMVAGSLTHAYADEHCAMTAGSAHHEDSACGDSSAPSACHFCCHAHGVAFHVEMTISMKVTPLVMPHSFLRAQIPVSGAILEIDHPPQLS